jgi:hypothetical protein
MNIIMKMRMKRGHVKAGSEKKERVFVLQFKKIPKFVLKKNLQLVSFNGWKKDRDRFNLSHHCHITFFWTKISKPIFLADNPYRTYRPHCLLYLLLSNEHLQLCLYHNAA